MAPPNNKQKDPPYFLSPPKLWLIDGSITNYVVWRAMVHDQFKRDHVLGFIDGTVEKPLFTKSEEFDHWREESDKPVKERLLSLVDQDVAPTDHQLKTCSDIWLELELKFKALQETQVPQKTPPEGSDPHQAEPGTSTDRKRQQKPKMERTFTIINTVTSSEYMKLHRAALLGDMSAAKHIFQNDVGSMIRNNAIALSMEQIVSEPHSDDLNHVELRMLPDYTAPIYSRRQVLNYLISEYNSRDRTPYIDTARFILLISAIDAELFDSALSLWKNHPYLAELKLSSKSALTHLASKKSLFGRPRRGPRKSYIVEDVKVEPATTNSKRRNSLITDLQDCIIMVHIDGWPTLTSALNIVLNGVLFPFLICIASCTLWIACSPLFVIFGMGFLPWELLRILGFVDEPERPKFNLEAFILVQKLCEQMKNISGQVEEIYGDAILLAARSGVHVVVEEIVYHSPGAALCWDHVSSQYIFHMAVESRDHHLFCIVYENILEKKDLHLSLDLLDLPDINGNNILHLAGKSSPPDVLAKIRGSVLQIQHELRWYKGIEKLVSPRCREKLNREEKTPKMIFIEEHKELKDKAEKWMKDTASSCTIIAALISTIMFAAAITVPGGNNGTTGFPVFTGNKIFLLFAISDGISFVTSLTALLMFMEIMMSRYEPDDFMRHLPIRLFIGLGSLLISIMFMMLTFSVTVYLVFGQPRHWVLISVATVTCYIVILFGYLQGSLIFELIKSTYRDDFIPVSMPSESFEDQSDNLIRIRIQK